MKTADLFNDPAQLLALVGGVVIPFLVALLSRPSASPAVKAALAVISAGLLALGVYLTNTDGARTWQGAVSVFVIALVMAAASRVSVTGHSVDKLQASDIGIVG